MRDWGTPTGSLPVVRDLLGLMTFPPQTVSVRAARRFVTESLQRTDIAELADDAGLLVSELAANAVLHARTDFDVAVSELGGGRGVRVTVRDHAEALPVLTAPSATAMSGRGLALVQTLAARWGAGPSASARKGVWFELDAATAPSAGPDSGSDVHFGVGSGGLVAGPAGAAAGPVVPGVAEMSVEELLAAWSDAEEAQRPDDGNGPGASGVDGTDNVSGINGVSSVSGVGEATPGASAVAAAGGVAVVLPALDAVALLAAKEGMDDLLRELQLVLLDPRELSDQFGRQGGRSASEENGDGGDAAAEGLKVARRLDEAARAFDGVRRQVRQQVSRAVAAGQPVVQLRLHLPAGTAAAALAYLGAVEAAEALASRGGLLSASAGALPSHRAVRRAYLGEVIAAAQ